MTTVSYPLPMLLLTAATALISSMYRVGKDPHEGKIVLQDIMVENLEVSCVGEVNLEWNTDLIETTGLENLISHSACTVARSATNLKELTNFPERDDVQWMKHILSRSDAPRVTVRGKRRIQQT